MMTINYDVSDELTVSIILKCVKLGVQQAFAIE